MRLNDEDKIICPNCGALVGREERYCGNCGTRLTDVIASSNSLRYTGVYADKSNLFVGLLIGIIIGLIIGGIIGLGLASSSAGSTVTVTVTRTEIITVTACG